MEVVGFYDKHKTFTKGLPSFAFNAKTFFYDLWLFDTIIVINGISKKTWLIKNKHGSKDKLTSILVHENKAGL